MESTQSSSLINLGRLLTSVDWFKWSSVFQNILVGLGALAAIFFGWIQVKPLLQAAKKRSAEYWMKRYPKESFGKTFKLIASSKNTGKIYLLDLEKGTKHHIASQPTRYDINMDDLEVQMMGTTAFEGIREGERILTQGKPGD